MKKIGIIGAMSVEIEALLCKMENKAEVAVHDMTFTTGKLCGMEIVLTNCGIGKVNAAIITQMMIDKFSPCGIINTGIAGSFDQSVKHLDVVISKEATYHDVRKGQMKNWYPKQEAFKADEAFIKAAADSAGQCHIGLVLTGDDFIDSDEKKNKIKENHSGLCLEMEGAAIAHACYMNYVPFVIIRTISDMADGAVDVDYAKFEAIAAEKSAGIVEKMLAILAK